MQNSKLQTKIYNFLTIWLVFFVLFVALPVFAAEISFDSETKDVNLGSQFEMGIFLVTGSEDINAVEGKISFPNELLELKEIREGNSIISFWAKKPQNSSPGEIIFSGIIPGGYKGEKGPLFTIIFQAKKIGQGKVGFYNLRALKNDGLGSPANVSISDFQFSISNPPASQTPAPQVPTVRVKDTEPPEIFQPEISRDETMFENKWFLVFASQDKGSGIAGYEVQENKNQEIEGGKWEKAENPYVLKDQKLRSYIYIKAIDKAGNERIVILPPKYPLKWYEIYWWRELITVLILSTSYIIWRVWRAKHTKEKF